MSRYRAILLSAFCSAHVAVCCFGEWVRLDDFQGYPVGQSLSDTDGWAVKDKGATWAVVKPDNFLVGNQAVKIGRNDTDSNEHDIFYQFGGGVNIQPGQTATVYCRFMVESGLDETLGNTVGAVQQIDLTFSLTDGTLLHAGNRRATARVQGGENTKIWAGLKYDDGAKSLERNRWYGLWIVINNTGEKYEQSKAYYLADGESGDPVLLPGNPVDDGIKPGILQVFGLVKSRNCGLTDIWVDDFYVDHSGENLTDPVKSEPAMSWREKLEDEAGRYKEFLKKASTWEQAEQQAMALLDAMTPEERFELVTGNGWLGLPAFPRLGIPPVNFSDASGGINNHPAPVKKRHPKTIAYPCPALLNATWNPEMAEQYARSIGEECRSANTHILLGPGMNMYRSSNCGRNFEYMGGDDPYLAARMVEAYVKGMQSTGTGATLKHFIANESEFKRRVSNSVVGLQALHEIYMPPFKAGIDAGALCVMSSYNRVNGEWAAQSEFVNKELLRGELGFQGLIMTDWIASPDGRKLAKAGTDLEMPAGWGLKKYKADVFGTPEIDQMALSILRTCIYAGYYEEDYAKPELENNRRQWEAVAEKTNQQGITLLRNNGVLPIATSMNGKMILVSGNKAEERELGGSGSGHVYGYNATTYVEAVRAEYPDANVVYAVDPAAREIANADFVVLFPGFKHEGEGGNRSFIIDEDEMIQRCVSENKNTIVCVVAGGGVCMDWAEDAAAVIYAFYGGQTGAEAMMDVLTGRVNPSGKLPFTIENRFEDSPAYGDDDAPPDKSVVFDKKDFPKMYRFFTNNDQTEAYGCTVNYGEGIFMGYRWYDMKKIPVRFPFGFGLSYTTFEYSDFSVIKGDGNTTRVQFKITNTGFQGGAETAQVYVRDLQSKVPRPEKELRGFQKVFLEKGQAKTVTVDLPEISFQRWSPEANGWVMEGGRFEIMVGASSRDIRLHEMCNL